jgi:type III secretory pathway lipoprotein EscJ
MSLELNLDIWEAMQEHIVDVKGAADDFVAVLVENGIDAEKIADVTTNEDIRKALLDYDIDIEVEEDDFEFFNEED